MIKEHDCVVLTQDLPDGGLKAGDIGTVVHIHENGAAYEVEFMTLAGETICVATLLAIQVRPIARGTSLTYVRLRPHDQTADTVIMPMAAATPYQLSFLEALQIVYSNRSTSIR
jgi:uncharacterized protein DUF4926